MELSRKALASGVRRIFRSSQVSREADPLEPFRDVLSSWEVDLVNRIVEAQITMVSVPKMVDTILRQDMSSNKTSLAISLRQGFGAGAFQFWRKLCLKSLGLTKRFGFMTPFWV